MAVSTAQRFAFAELLSSGRQRLMLAELNAPGATSRAASTVRTLGDLPGAMPTTGEVPETWQSLVPSRDNRYLAALSMQLGVDFLDANVRVYDLDSGALQMLVNEHSFAGIDRSSASSPLFDAVLAQEAAAGVPQAQLDSYDYSLEVEGAAFIGPELIWTESGTLLLSYRFGVFWSGTYLGHDPFEFELSPTGPATMILSINADRAPTRPPPDDYFGVASGGTAADGNITFRGAPLWFRWFAMSRLLLIGKWLSPRFLRWVVRLLPFRVLGGHVRALLVAGYAR